MGYLITVEGGEFTGKTSVVVPALKQILETAGHDVLVSREPGGTPEAEAIRKEISDLGHAYKEKGEEAPPEKMAELFNKAREIHLKKVVNPFFKKHKEGVVLLDRYADSTMVYQGLEGGVSLETLLRLHAEHAKNRFPDLTFILQFPENEFENTFLRRREFAKGKDDGRSQMVWDEGEVEHHLQRQRNYLRLPDVYEDLEIPREFRIVDAAQHPLHVVSDCVEGLDTFFSGGNHEGKLYDTFNRLREKGAWKGFNDIWDRQQEMTEGDYKVAAELR